MRRARDCCQRSMPVSAALAIINDVLGDVLDGEEAELDADTRFTLTWS